MIGVGCFTMFEHHSLHFIFAFLGFFNVIVYQVMVWFKIHGCLDSFNAKSRALYILIQAASLIIVGFSEDIFDHRYCVTLSTLGEYSLLFFLQAFLLSFYRYTELQNCQIVLFEE